MLCCWASSSDIANDCNASSNAKSTTCPVTRRHWSEGRNFYPDVVYFNVCHENAHQYHDINMGNILDRL
jgi:hypothetical protein